MSPIAVKYSMRDQIVTSLIFREPPNYSMRVCQRLPFTPDVVSVLILVLGFSSS